MSTCFVYLRTRYFQTRYNFIMFCKDTFLAINRHHSWGAEEVAIFHIWTLILKLWWLVRSFWPLVKRCVGLYFDSFSQPVNLQSHNKLDGFADDCCCIVWRCLWRFSLIHVTVILGALNQDHLDLWKSSLKTFHRRETTCMEKVFLFWLDMLTEFI